MVTIKLTVKSAITWAGRIILSWLWWECAVRDNIVHEHPTFWLAWNTLSDEELPCAAYKMYNILYVYKKQSLYTYIYVYSIPKGNDMNKACLWSKGHLFLARELLNKSSKEIWSNSPLSWMSDCKSIYIQLENMQVLHFCWLKIESKYTEKMMIFSAILKFILKFLYQNGKHGCIFLIVHSTVFNQCIKMHIFFAITWACHCVSVILNSVIVWNIA